MPYKKQGADVEWLAGIFDLAGLGEPSLRKMLAFRVVDGPLIAFKIDSHINLLDHAAEVFSQALAAPLEGDAHVPKRLRIESKELAGRLGLLVPPETDLKIGPTPELQEMVAQIARAMGANEDEGEEDDRPSIQELKQFYRAVASFYRKKPWALLPKDPEMIGFLSDRLDLEFGCVAFSSKPEFHMSFFPTLEDFVKLNERAERLEREPVDLESLEATFMTLGFVKASEVGPFELRWIKDNDLPIAGPKAYPVFAVSDHGLLRPPTALELNQWEGIFWALSKLLDQPAELIAALAGGMPFGTTLAVETFRGQAVLMIWTPLSHLEAVLGKADDDEDEDESEVEIILEELTELELDEKLESRRKSDLDARLIELFYQTPEGRPFASSFFSSLLLNMAANHLGRTIATLQVAELEEILFELIPQKVSIGPEAAPRVMAEIKAFLEFLDRESVFLEAAVGLDLLDPSGIARLEAALGHTENFGLAKSLVMSSIPVDVPLPALLSRVNKQKPANQNKKKKNKRKAEKASRRHNR